MNGESRNVSQGAGEEEKLSLSLQLWRLNCNIIGKSKKVSWSSGTNKSKTYITNTFSK